MGANSDSQSTTNLHNVILEIVSGQKITTISYCDYPVLFTYPDSKVLLYFNFLEESRCTDYLNSDYISNEDIEKENLLENIFLKEDQEKLSNLQEKRLAYIKMLSKRDPDSTQYKSNLTKIEDLNHQVQELENKKSFLDTFSAEYKAKEDAYLYLFSECCCTLNGDKVWNSVSDMEDGYKSLENFYNDLNKFLRFYIGHDVKLIRKIARSNQWRTYYISSSKGLINSVFDKNVKDLSADQIHLLSWSTFYGDVFDMPLSDRPSEEIINDDDRLDKYLENLQKKIIKETKKSKILDKSSKAQAHDHQHVVVTAESDNYVSFHKNDMYSDTELISGRVKSGKQYDEKKEMRKLKQRKSKLKKGIK